MPELVAPGVYRVDTLRFPYAVSVFLIEAGGGWTLVDAGAKGSLPRIQEALSALGVGPEDLRRVYLTHHHVDHAGGLPEVREWAPGAEVVTSEKEAEVLSGRRAPEPPNSAILRAMARVQRPPVVPVDRVADEGEVVAGFRLLATPGHSLGHTALLRDEDGVLLAGDAFGELPRGLRVGVRAAFCHSPAQALRSARKLLEEDFVTAAFAHGRTLRSGTKETLREVVERCDYE